ncbi:phage tail tube protein [Sphingopyxis sp. J-6]|uniref:phage tail tube protein n=1 Tax=Sphingopyxis sp. J-6 TaxID=3122054 RepID=UPI0039840838
MTVAAKTSFGAELWMAVSGGSLAKVAELKSLTPPKHSRGTIDVTTHDSPAGAREFITEGVYDTGEVSGSIHYIAGSAGDDAMLTAVTGGAKHDFKVVLKSAADTEDLEFEGFVTEYGPDDQPVEGVQMASFTVKVSGAIAQAATA